MQLIVDRITGRFAVCENEKGETVTLPMETLPEGVHEGAVLLEEAGRYRLDEARERALREKTQKLWHRLTDPQRGSR